MPRESLAEAQNNQTTPLLSGNSAPNKSIRSLMQKIIKLFDSDYDLTPDANNWTALHDAAARRQTGKIKHILSQKNVDVNFPSKGGYTPFFHAVESRCYDSVKLLLNDPRVDPNRGTDDGDYPLRQALILAGKYKNTTVEWISKQYENIVELLLKNDRVKVSINDLNYAIFLGLNDIVSSLLCHNDILASDLNGIDKNGLTPIQAAATNSHNNKVLKLFLSMPTIDVNKQNKNGKTVLMSVIATLKDTQKTTHVNRDTKLKLYTKNIKLLLDHAQIDIYKKPGNGSDFTLLQLAKDSPAQALIISKHREILGNNTLGFDVIHEALNQCHSYPGADEDFVTTMCARFKDGAEVTPEVKAQYKNHFNRLLEISLQISKTLEILNMPETGLPANDENHLLSQAPSMLNRLTSRLTSTADSNSNEKSGHATSDENAMNLNQDNLNKSQLKNLRDF